MAEDGKSSLRSVSSNPSGRSGSEMRRHRRVATAFQAQASTKDGSQVIGTIRDISFSGLRLEGDRALLNALMPNIERHNQHIPAPITIEFDLPDRQEKARARVVSGAAYTRRSDNDTYQIGMQLIDVEDGAEALTGFLVSQGAAPSGSGAWLN
ncbi:PilZ domain-containing protein [Pseudomaricurvus alkylphenolicus]|jgi:hypothetical protein|uniref:PilZ domain-containing protein n=1 Tax=Pseudomaricurvus alkylphenolicus TaxID=1306991 RepID=UPI00141E1005|nr:PilZ domain-containing protein [Pseudomaricurvus alkylphenolicus]NIB40895.1 PilZ domain-containing protein [Pseudomaricurvus alkylphenolicus]